MTELKPCPKCGVPPKIGYVCGEYLVYGDDPECPYCGQSFAEMHSSEKLEIEAWNRRVEMICGNCLHRAVCGKHKATGGVNKCEHHAEERHGRWIHHYHDSGELIDDKWYCSECHMCNEHKRTWYCPNCGAKMDGGNVDV